MPPSPNPRFVTLAERPSIDEALAAHASFQSHLIADPNAVVPARVAASEPGADDPEGARFPTEPTDLLPVLAGFAVPDALSVGKVVLEAVDVRGYDVQDICGNAIAAAGGV